MREAEDTKSGVYHGQECIADRSVSQTGVYGLIYEYMEETWLSGLEWMAWRGRRSSGGGGIGPFPV